MSCDRTGATGRDRLVEIEFAVGQLADAGQSLAEGVEAVGLGLQLAQACGEGVDLVAGRRHGRIELGLPAGNTRAEAAL
jgi:hypothetical protein